MITEKRFNKVRSNYGLDEFDHDNYIDIVHTYGIEQYQGLLEYLNKLNPKVVERIELSYMSHLNETLEIYDKNEVIENSKDTINSAYDEDEMIEFGYIESTKTGRARKINSSYVWNDEAVMELATNSDNGYLMLNAEGSEYYYIYAIDQNNKLLFKYLAEELGNIDDLQLVAEGLNVIRSNSELNIINNHSMLAEKYNKLNTLCSIDLIKAAEVIMAQEVMDKKMVSLVNLKSLDDMREEKGMARKNKI